jgi:hypothetical protein
MPVIISAPSGEFITLLGGAAASTARYREVSQI